MQYSFTDMLCFSKAMSALKRIEPIHPHSTFNVDLAKATPGTDAIAETSEAPPPKPILRPKPPVDPTKVDTLAVNNALEEFMGKKPAQPPPTVVAAPTLEIAHPKVVDGRKTHTKPKGPRAELMAYINNFGLVEEIKEVFKIPFVKTSMIAIAAIVLLLFLILNFL